MKRQFEETRKKALLFRLRIIDLKHAHQQQLLSQNGLENKSSIHNNTQ